MKKSLITSRPGVVQGEKLGPLRDDLIEEGILLQRKQLSSDGDTSFVNMEAKTTLQAHDVEMTSH